MFYDLRIPHDHSQQIVNRAIELEYDAYALDQVVEAKNLKKLKPPAAESASDFIAIDSNIVDAVNDEPKRYSRITIVLENNTNLQLSHLKYDIIAVQPTTEKAFIACCSNADIDLISLEFDSRLPFYIKSSSVSLAMSKGIYFEISYAAAISDLNARKSLAINSKNLIRATKGKNIIISSNAQNAMQLRGPNDLMNLYSLFGLNPDKAKAALSKTCRSLLLQAGILN
jgi:RNase P/RNase MRP subunit p30